MNILKAGRPLYKQKALEMINGEQYVRLNVNVEKSQYKKIKQFAVENDMTISAMILIAVKQYMSK